MSNSPLVTYTNLSPNYTPLTGKVNELIVIHCYVGQVTAKRGCDGFAAPERQASAQYIIGYEGSKGQSVKEEHRAWTTGGSKKNPNTGKMEPIRVNGISGASVDYKAITIEVACEPKHPYAVTEKAMEALIDLLVDNCQRNPSIGRLRWKADKSLVGNWAEQNMVVHRWFAAKACPGDYLYQRMGEIAKEVNRRLDAAENKNKEDQIDMEEVKKLLEEQEKRILEALTPTVYNTLGEIRKEAPWAEATVCKLIAKGAIQGTTGAKDEEGNPAGLALTMELLRVLVINDRSGIYGE